MRALLSLLADTARAMAGIPSYRAYLTHMRAAHPDAPVMDRTAFFRDRQQARYGSGGGRCC